MKERVMFFSAVIIVFGLFQFIVYRVLRKYLNEKKLDSKLWKRLSISPFIIFSIPFLYLLVLRSVILPKFIYQIYIIPFFIFQASIFFIALYILAGKLIKLPFIIVRFIILKIKLLKVHYRKFRSRKAVVLFDESRRAFIRSSTILVAGFAFTGASIGVIKKDDFVIKRKDIKINKLPEQLKGLKIVQVNDIHSGPFMEFEQMDTYKKVINDLNPDIVMIPGDMTNTLANEVYPFIDAFKDLKSKYGTFATLGNHDYFSNPELIANEISWSSPIDMLRNDFRILKINGKQLMIMGIEDTRSSGSRFTPEIKDYLEKTIIAAKNGASDERLDYEELPKILLYHKPYFFPYIHDKKLDLILSGHTHGGQVVLANIGNLNLSIASTVSPYISGLYKENGSQMYISDGLGTVGLPIRLNCPPEITVITLV